MALRDLTSAEAVHAAIAEYDERGGPAFLADHDFGVARRYWLVHEGRRYDSKAVAGVAHGYQFPELGPLRAEEFSGGERGAAAQLRMIGFEVVEDGRPVLPADESGDEVPWSLGRGDTIKRVALHDLYGGSRQDGVSPSARTPNVLIFSDAASGEQHGYVDRWGADGVFYYTGRGQRGDQTLTSGNKAILDHRNDGRAIRVFEGAKGTVRYAGRFTLDEQAPYEIQEAPETGGGPLRKVIVFRLVPMLEDGVTSPLAPAAIPARRGTAGQPYRSEDEDTDVAAPSAPTVDPDSVGRGLKSHRRLQNAVAAALRERGIVAMSPLPSTPNYDIAWEHDGLLVAVEIKSLSDANEVRQLRGGLGQVLDYADVLAEAGHRV